MGLQDKITKIDAMNLKLIQKKLNLPYKRLVQAHGLNQDTTLTQDEKVRILLGIPDDVETIAYLESKLNEREMVSIRKFVNLDSLYGE